MGHLRRLLGGAARLFLALAIALTPASAAPRPDRTETYSEHGFSLDRPTRFEARPVPDVADLLLVFAPRDAPADQRSPVTHTVFKVPGATTAEDVQRWVQGRLQPYELEPERSVRVRYGRRPARFVGRYRAKDVGERELFVHAWLGDADAVVFVGECDPTVARRETRAFDRVASSFRFFTGEETSARRAEWERRYMRSSLPHVEERIEVASELVAGWEVRDTQHSIILFHGRGDAPALAQIAEHLVAVRARFAEDFPPDRPIDALSIVRVCRDRGEYLTYGGSAATVGFFNPKTQELVLYDARTDRSGPIPDGHPTLRTLYHEACHQFLYHTASALSPHSWYDEGTAEYYAGAQLRMGRVQGIDPLPERGAYLQRGDVRDRIPRLAVLLRMTQAEFYADADVNYSMGYALIRFLRTAPAAKAERAYRELPDRYFRTLRTVWRQEAERLALSGITGEKYAAALERSREAALAAALEGIDVDALETAFLAWLMQS